MQANHAEQIIDGSSGVAFAPLPLSQEDQARADLYALISRLFIAAPDESLLAALANADSMPSQQTDHPLDIAWEKLILTASIMDHYAVQDEFNELFISVGNPQVNPYASVYLAGFMNEKPLARLRAELAQLGLARAPGVGELEDHIAALCETMRILISGGPSGERLSVQRQKLFFEKYIRSWTERCLDDVGKARGANFYQLVALFAQAFFDVEAQAFEMEEALSSE
jgi:TorA maturation chaperone TorD